MRLIEPSWSGFLVCQESFMQGLAHNLSIRWMDGQGGGAEGWTGNGVENHPESVVDAVSFDQSVA